MARRKAPRIPDAILDQLLAGADPKTAFEADGLLDELKKALAERALNAEMETTIWRARRLATRATAMAARRSPPRPAGSSFRSRATGRPRSIRS